MTTTLAQILGKVGAKGVTDRSSPISIANASYVSDMRSQVNRVIQTYRQVIADVEGAIPDILYEALEPTLELAKSYTPKDTGALRASGYIEKRPLRGKPSVVIGFAKGGTPEYAAIVHERVDLKHAEPTRSKFLTAALFEDLAAFYARVVVRCKI